MKETPARRETGGSSSPVVVTDEGIDRPETERCGDMDRVERAQSRLGECAGGSKEGAVERQESNGVEQFFGSLDQAVRGQ